MTEIKDQPAPEKNDTRPIWDIVIEDMKQRNEEGVKKYGTPLQIFNGRDSLVDLYQELLDAVVYTRQKIEEQKYFQDNFEALEQASDDYIEELTTQLNICKATLHTIMEDSSNEADVELSKSTLEQLDEMNQCVVCGINYAKCDC